MAAIAARLGVTESRVSQLRAEGVALLRGVLAEATRRPAPRPRRRGPVRDPALPVAGRAGRAVATARYAASVAAAGDSRTSIGVGTAVLGGLFAQGSRAWAAPTG